MFNKLWWWVLAILAGSAGGVLLSIGHFHESLIVLQAAALVPVLLLACKQKRIAYAIVAGVCMGLVAAIPQVITLHLPPWMAVVLVTEFTIVLTLLCALTAAAMKKDTLLGCFVVGAGWMLLDWLNYTAIPIWGMAQSMARGWSAYPHLIAFIRFTGISGILFVIGTLQALFVRLCCTTQKKTRTLAALAAVPAMVLAMDLLPYLDKPVGTLRVAAAGWTSIHALGGFYGPDQKKEEFNALFADPAAAAAGEGARIFASGEMAFNIDDNRREPWIALFAEVARKNNIYLVVGYISARQGNRLFVMNPQGDIIADYLKTYLSPPEWGGKHGKGELPHIDVEGISVGAMICHDDNFSRLTRYYGRYKTPLVMIPTWDWYEVRDAHLSAVRARAIECRYGIARSAYHGIAAIIGPSGDILARHDTQSDGHGYCIADVPLYQDVTVFARLGHTPMVAVSALLILAFICRSLRRRKPALADG